MFMNINLYFQMCTLQFHSILMYCKKQYHKSHLCIDHKKWEPTKNSFINNIDQNMVNALDLLLKDSQNIPLNENQNDFFAKYVKNVFHKSVKSSFEKYTVVAKKVKNP